MTSYRRISGRTLNREVNNSGYMDIYMSPISRGIYPSLNPDAPVNGIITGNLSVSGNSSLTGTLGVGGNTIINGNLTVKGTTYVIDSSNISIADALIELNRGVSGANTNDSGIIIDRGTSGDNAFMGWRESLDRFMFGTTTSDASSNGAITGFVPKTIYANTAALDTSGSLIFTTGTFSTTIQVTEPTTNKTITFPNATGTVSLLTNTETLTNKTLTLPKINDLTSTNTYDIVGTELAANRTITLPLLTGNDTFVFVDHVQTLTNKSLTNPDIDGGTIDSTQIGTTTPDSGAFTTLAASGTLTVMGDVDIEGNVDVSGNIIIGTGHAVSITHTSDAAGEDFTIAQAGAVDSSLILSSTGTGADALQITASAGGMDIDSAGAMSLNSSGGAINLGNDAVAQAINVGTGAADRTITVGNATGATSVAINAGTAGVPITSTAATTNAVSISATALTTGIALNISANALTTGSALDITSTSAGKTTGGLVNIAQTGATTTQTAPSLTVSTSATTDAGAGVASFTGNALTAGNAVSISATALVEGSALKITAAASKMALNVAAGVSRFNGGSITQGTTIYTGGGLDTISAAELINGYTYVGAAGGTVALTFPGAGAVETALGDMGITSAAGTRLSPILVAVTDANNLTVTEGAGETRYGTAAINNIAVIIQYIFTSNNTAAIIIQRGS